MRAITATPLEELREKEKELKDKDAQLLQLGIALTEEKIKNAQKDAMLEQIGKEVIELKIKVMTLEGGVK